MAFKEWIFYLIVTWEELTGQGQKTIILQFDVQKECISIMNQVKTQIEGLGGVLKVKHGICYRCKDIYEKDRCPQVQANTGGWKTKTNPTKKK